MEVTGRTFYITSHPFPFALLVPWPPFPPNFLVVSYKPAPRLTLTDRQVTRSHKLNDRDHPADGTIGTRDHPPRYFAKSGPTDADPRKAKKDGGGKGNWCVVWFTLFYTRLNIDCS